MTELSGRAADAVHEVGELATQAVGTIAGAVADPATGLSKIRALLSSPRSLVSGVLLLGVYFAGRRRGSRN
jgi:hypothetical protein